MRNKLLPIVLIFICLNINFYSQKKPLDLAIIGEELKEFSLPIYQGGEFQLSNERGKNVLLVFPRGYYDKDVWCDICAYEYLDLVDEFNNKKLDEKYDLDVVIILPYNKSTIDRWLMDIPEVYSSLEAGKHLADTTTNEKAKVWVHFANKHYPKTFNINKGETPQPFKILVDEKHEISERFEIFKTEWWGTTVDQNMPTFILLDKDGMVVFKYISQHTIDRPTLGYLMKIMDAVIQK